MVIFKIPFLLSVFSGLFLALNFSMLFLFYLTPEFEWRSLGYQLKNYAEIASLFFTIGFIVSVVFAIFIGWPLYLLAKFYSAVNYITSGLAGLAVTMVPYAIYIFSGGLNIPNVTEKSVLIIFLVLVICGGSSGLLFHFLEKNKRAQSNYC